MNDLDQRYLEIRALRNAAKVNFLADLDHAKHSFSGKGLTERVLDRIGDGARDVFEQASEAAEDNRGTIAILIGAIVLWLSRGPLLQLFGAGSEEDNEFDAPPHGAPSPQTSGEDDDRSD